MMQRARVGRNSTLSDLQNPASKELQNPVLRDLQNPILSEIHSHTIVEGPSADLPPLNSLAFNSRDWKREVAARVAARYAHTPSYQALFSEIPQGQDAADLSGEKTAPLRRKSQKNAAPSPMSRTNKPAAHDEAVLRAISQGGTASLFDSTVWLRAMADEAQSETSREFSLHTARSAKPAKARRTNRHPGGSTATALNALAQFTATATQCSAQETGMLLFDFSADPQDKIDPAPSVAKPISLALAERIAPTEPMNTRMNEERAGRFMDAGPHTPAQDTAKTYANAEDIPVAPIDDWMQPIATSLIEFPRELVAVRKARPRLAEGPLAAMSALSDEQLSIFEVESSTIAPMPEMSGHASSPSPTWSMIELEALPAQMRVEHEEQAANTVVNAAPWSRRALAGVMDAALIFIASVAVAVPMALHAPVIIGSHAVGISVALVAIIGVLYEGIFALLRLETPGMLYAELRLSTLEDENPTREQMQRRVASLILSLLPIGLGVTWALFDEDRLCWHDRFSGTYPRKAV